MNASPDARWGLALRLIKESVPEQIYTTWFEPIVFETFDEARSMLILQVSSNYVVEYLEGKYMSLLARVLRQCFGDRISLSYRVVTDKEHNLSQQIESDTAPGIAPFQGGNVEQVPQQNKETARTGTSASTIEPEQSSLDLDPQLNPHLSFSNYIEGSGNRVARAMGLSIAEHPETTGFNPMFIYGPSGCGKTHLINAIGVRCKQLYPQKRVLYVSARIFQVQYTNAVVKNTFNDFIAFYQTIDMLIVDDIQEWITATKTQHTFFFIFDHLLRNGKRIILASDRMPSDLKGMHERLITRFSGGLTTPIDRPDVQLCVDILKSKIRRDGLKIPDDVVQLIAETANGSVRELEGTVNSLMAYSIVYSCEVDMRLAERVIHRAVKQDDRPLTIDDILEKVCNHFGVTTAQVNSRSRKQDLVRARQVAMYFAQKLTKMPAARIGRLVAGRDHSTVLHSCQQVEKKLKTDSAFADEMKEIESSFRLKNEE